MRHHIQNEDTYKKEGTKNHKNMLTIHKNLYELTQKRRTLCGLSYIWTIIKAHVYKYYDLWTTSTLTPCMTPYNHPETKQKKILKIIFHF